METEEKQSNGGTALRQVLIPTQRNMRNNVFEFFYRTGAPTHVAAAKPLQCVQLCVTP